MRGDNGSQGPIAQILAGTRLEACCGVQVILTDRITISELVASSGSSRQNILAGISGIWKREVGSQGFEMVFESGADRWMVAGRRDGVEVGRFVLIWPSRDGQKPFHVQVWRNINLASTS